MTTTIYSQVPACGGRVIAWVMGPGAEKRLQMPQLIVKKNVRFEVLLLEDAGSSIVCEMGCDDGVLRVLVLARV